MSDYVATTNDTGILTRAIPAIEARLYAIGYDPVICMADASSRANCNGGLTTAACK